MLRKLRLRRDELKTFVTELRQQVKELHSQLQDVADNYPKKKPVIIDQDLGSIPPELAQNNSNNASVPINYFDNPSRALVPQNHHYDARVISMDRYLVTIAGSSFCAAGKSLKVIKKYLPIDTPKASSIRQWVYRIGSSELFLQPKPKKASLSIYR